MNLFEALETYPGVAIGFTVILGLLVGSFLNVVIHRLPKMMERDWEEQCKEFIANQNDVASSPPPKQGPFNLMVPRSR